MTVAIKLITAIIIPLPTTITTATYINNNDTYDKYADSKRNCNKNNHHGNRDNDRDIDCESNNDNGNNSDDDNEKYSENESNHNK